VALRGLDLRMDAGGRNFAIGPQVVSVKVQLS